jgi:AcrR family transcriptional regulator
MSRASDLTREALLQSATAVFADKGYEAGSVREITRKAKANQAAIAYHFGGKEGLYREVLRAMIAAFREGNLLDPERFRDLDRDEALRLLLRQQLEPLSRRNQLGQYLRILNGELVQPTATFDEVMKDEKVSFLGIVETVVRRFVGDAETPEAFTVLTFWLAHQAFSFVRDWDHLTEPGSPIRLDERFVDRLVDMLFRLVRAGLMERASGREGLITAA